MNVTALEEYGLRCAVRLGAASEGKTLSAAEIAAAEGLSVEYVSKFMLHLRKAGLVRTVRGAHGGFALSRAPDQISLREVFEALSGKKRATEEFCTSYSGRSDSCVHLDACSIRPFWTVIQSYMDQFTMHMTIADLLQPQEHTRMRVKQIAARVLEEA